MEIAQHGDIVRAGEDVSREMPYSPRLSRHSSEFSKRSPAESHDTTRTTLSNSRIKIRAAVIDGGALPRARLQPIVSGAAAENI